MPPSSQSGLLQIEIDTFLVVQIYSAQMSLSELQDVPEFKGHSYFFLKTAPFSNFLKNTSQIKQK